MFFSDENCCGSQLRFEQTIPCPPFQRFASGGGFFVSEGVPKNKDVAPPSRIIDFRRKDQHFQSEFVTFEWTSPGQDFNFGKGKHHKILLLNANLVSKIKKYAYLNPNG